ncbi:MAG TPA: ACT domain-containing protein, partial [Actinomycetota bacterium]|nr:ACT domain-containing protein [Actinomycetota bacterium]
VALGSNSDPGTLEAALTTEVANLELSVAVRPVPDLPPEQATGDGYTLSVYGADRPGIVARVSALLAERGVNIWDLATHVIEGEQPVYVMILEIAVPSGSDAAALEAELSALARELGVDVSLQPMEPETL